MQLNSLRLVQVRGYEQAEFQFLPGMNLLVGVNGVGKSTVLDVLRILLSQALPEFTASKSKPAFLTINDITIDKDFLTAEAEFEALGTRFGLLNHKQREDYSEKTLQPKSFQKPAHHVGRRKRIELQRSQQEGYTRPEYSELYMDTKLSRQIKSNPEQPFAVYYSTRRSMFNRTASSKSQQGIKEQALAFADALIEHRELSSRQFAEWWTVRQTLAEESGFAVDRFLSVLEDAALSFLDNFDKLWAERSDNSATLKIRKVDFVLDVHQLSDGERGILALVLDLARRLALANPKLDNPLGKGQAVVLIDEIDLHLHPRWQRTVVQKLTETFPACQFVATTHSPQIIGEVAPENIILLEPGKQPYRPDQSLGMDSNWILQMLMDAPERNEETTRQLEQINDLLEDGSYEEAAEAIERLREQIPSDPELARLQTRLDRLQILGE